MKKFSLEEYLAHPEKKVVTRDGRRVEILSVTCKVRESQPILAQIEGAKKSFTLEYYYKNGTALDKNYNLFFADEEPELTEFEKAVTNCYTRDTSGKLLTQEELVARAKELLEIAREELFAELKEYAETARERGKAEVLKDLPRWKKQNCWEQMGTFMGVKDKEYFVVKDGYAISMSELMNFPGFKEDEK